MFVQITAVYVFKQKFDFDSYTSYIADNKEHFVDMFFKNNPDYAVHKKHIILDVDSALELINNGVSFLSLKNVTEKMMMNEILIAAMNELGVK